MDVKIKQATLGDKERIGHFMQVAYGDRAQYKFPARWTWLFEDNPFWRGEGLPIWLAEVDGQIVGQTCEMVIPLKVGDGVYPAAWGIDYVVLPEFRRQGIGRRLQQVQSDYHDIFMALSMSPISRRVLVGFGFTEANAAVEFYKTIRFTADEARAILRNKLGSNNALSRACRTRSVAVASAAVLSLFRRLRDLTQQRPGMHDVILERTERFDGEIDQLWTRLAPRFPVIVQRNAAYLNWKFVEQPNMDYDLFVARRGQTVCGYVITRTGVPPEARIGIIADLFADPDDDALIHYLVAHATEHLWREDVRHVIAAGSVPEHVRSFLEQGFRKTREVSPMFRIKTVAHVPANGWFLSMGDHDWDQFPLVTGTHPEGA